MGAQVADGADLEGAQGGVNRRGAAWDDRDRWRALVDGSACPICARRRPRGVIAERATTWITSGSRVPTRGYVCVVSKRHVVEPWELEAPERGLFWDDLVDAAKRVAFLLAPVKVNYEIHGNSLPHLHAHVFPRFVGDAFAGGPIDPATAVVEHSDAEIERLRRALA